MHAYTTCIRVCLHNYVPSTSTSTNAPSLKRTALDTSLEKSTWPGESIKLIKNIDSTEGRNQREREREGERERDRDREREITTKKQTRNTAVWRTM